MFTPKNIQVALEELFDLCDPDYMMDMLENYGEEFDDISPVLLARAFQNSAEMVCEYRVLSIVGEGIDYRGEALLGNRAVKLLSCIADMTGDERVRTVQSKELWLAEDMTFYVVSCISTITIERQENNMHISYKPLWHTLLERDMRKEDLRLAAGMTTNMIANMSKEGKHISMDTLARICETLNCEITDVIELVPDEPASTGGKEHERIETKNNGKRN